MQRDEMRLQHEVMSAVVNRLEGLTEKLSSFDTFVAELQQDRIRAQQTRKAVIDAVEKTSATVSGALRAL